MNPQTFRRKPTRRGSQAKRRGAVAVEFACIVPLILAVTVGMLDLSRVYSVQNTLEAAAREGARFAGIDRSGLMLQNQTANQKIINDTKNYLASNDINPAYVTVSVVKASDPTQNFNVDDPANAQQLFQVRVSVPYSQICYSGFQKDEDYNLTAVLTYRNGRAPINP